MALVPIISQTWDTTSIFNPTRMNNIEQNLAIVSKATGVEYSSGVSVKDKIDDTITIDTLLTAFEVPTTATSYDCDWQNYYFISIEVLQYNNVRGEMLIPTSYFANTTSGSRPMINDFASSIFFQIYQNGNGKVYAISSSLNSAIGIRIYGVMKK